ncbi:MAG: DUF4139 domain-containing protein [Bacteroidota bacterium]
MKKKFIAILLMFPFLQLIAQEEPIPVKSTIKEVTVFLNGAQISRTATATVPKGASTMMFTDLSPYIDANSIQLTAKGDFTIMSVTFQQNYMVKPQKAKELTLLEDTLDKLNKDLEYQKSMRDVCTAEESMLNANKVVGGANTGLKLIDFKDNIEFFKSRLIEIKTRFLSLNEKIKKITDNIQRINQQIAVYSSVNKSSGVILIDVFANEAVQSDFALSYYVSNSGWVPIYDIRAKDVNSPISLVYKANVAQNSGEDWKNVKLTLSTGNPTLAGTKPQLNPWYLNFIYVNNYKNTNYSNRPATMNEASKPAMAGRVMKDEAKGEAYSIADYTEVSESQTSVQFDIKVPYTILSDGRNIAVEIQKHSVNAEYEYYCAPKLDRDAFLLAKITGWDQYNLLPGEANLYFEGTYVGKSYLNTRNVNDTLDISLGRDKSIIVTRTKLKDFSSTKTIGLNKKEIITWGISVRNQKKQAIKILVEDQFPISNDKDIEIEKLEMSSGIYNEETGKLTWKLKMEPSETKKDLKISYSIKYPKARLINL